VAVKTGAWSGQHLVWAFTDILDNSRAKVTTQWIFSHSKMKGNEEADQLAKNASATKQKYAKQLKTKWKNMWLTSPRCQKFE